MSDSIIGVIDDDHGVRRATERLLRSMGFQVEVFSSAKDFLLSAHVHHTSCLILDMQMPGMTGLELHRHLTAAGTRIPTIFITAELDQTVRARVLKAGALYLPKPFDDEDLLMAIRLALNIKPR